LRYVNHPSIWADKTQTDQDECFNYLAQTDKSGMISNDPIKLLKNQYTIKNNAVLYENQFKRKGKLSFWEFEK
jgi:hypothetical protein